MTVPCCRRKKTFRHARRASRTPSTITMMNLEKKKLLLISPRPHKSYLSTEAPPIFKVEVDNCETGRGIILPDPSERSRIVRTAEVKPQRTTNERKPVPSTVCVSSNQTDQHCLLSERKHNLTIRNPNEPEFLGLVRMFPLAAVSSSRSANTKRCRLPATQPLFGHAPEARPKVSRLGCLLACGPPASFYADFLQPSASHCCAYLPIETFVSCCPTPSSLPHPVPAPAHTILSSLGSVQT